MKFECNTEPERIIPYAKANLIYPMTEKHIWKQASSPIRIRNETAALYEVTCKSLNYLQFFFHIEIFIYLLGGAISPNVNEFRHLMVLHQLDKSRHVVQSRKIASLVLDDI